MMWIIAQYITCSVNHTIQFFKTDFKSSCNSHQHHTLNAYACPCLKDSSKSKSGRIHLYFLIKIFSGSFWASGLLSSTKESWINLTRSIIASSYAKMVADNLNEQDFKLSAYHSFLWLCRYQNICIFRTSCARTLSTAFWSCWFHTAWLKTQVLLSTS